MYTRWRKFATSGMIVNTSGHSGMHPKPSCVRRLRFLGFSSSFGSVPKIFGMSKIAEGLPEVAPSRGLRVSFSSTEWPSWDHRVYILLIRVAIAFTSCDHRRHRSFFSHDGNTMDTRSLPVVSGRLHDVASPSHSQRVATVWHFVTL